jgi:hypothetical protein
MLHDDLPDDQAGKKIPLLMRVEIGLPVNVFDTLDGGLGRAAPDTIYVASNHGDIAVENVNNIKLASGIRLALLYANKIYGYSENHPLYIPANGKLDNSRIVGMIQSNPDLVEGIAISHGFKDLDKLLLSGTGGVLYQIIKDVQSKKAAVEFLEMIATGADLPVGHPVLALRSMLIATRKSKGPMKTRNCTRAIDILSYCIKAWNLMIDGAHTTYLGKTPYDREGNPPVAYSGPVLPPPSEADGYCYEATFSI